MSYAQVWEDEHARREMRSDEPLQPVQDFFACFIEAMRKDSDLPPMKVLEVGCGQGTNLLWLAKQGFPVWGFDSSPSAAQRLLDLYTAKRGSTKAPSIIIADATKPWPYCSGSFDIVLDVRAIENMSLKGAAFAYKQIGRVLKRGGMFFTLTASELRADRYTTCGRVRQVGDMQLADMLKRGGMEIQSIAREYVGTLEDWRVVAGKL